MRTVAIVAISLVLAGTAAADQAMATHAVGIKKVDCPPGDLVKLVRKTFKHDKGDTMDGAVSCAGGHFPDAGWALGYRYVTTDKGANRYFERLAIVSVKGKVVKDYDTESPVAAAGTDTVKVVQAVDFNADFTDEVMVESTTVIDGRPVSRIYVYSLLGTYWEQLLVKVLTASDPSPDAGYECKGAYALGERDFGNNHRGVVITGTVTKHKKTPAKPIADCVDGSETWGPPKDQSFVKLK